MILQAYLSPICSSGQEMMDQSWLQYTSNFVERVG